MTKFGDSDGNIITEAAESLIMRFHDRYIINNFPLSCNEGDKVFVFDQENLDKIWKYHNDKIHQIREEMINLTERAIEVGENAQERNDKLKEENDNLRKLNKELSETIVQLKDVK